MVAFRPPSMAHICRYVRYILTDRLTSGRMMTRCPFDRANIDDTGSLIWMLLREGPACTGRSVRMDGQWSMPLAGWRCDHRCRRGRPPRQYRTGSGAGDQPGAGRTDPRSSGWSAQRMSAGIGTP